MQVQIPPTGLCFQESSAQAEARGGVDQPSSAWDLCRAQQPPGLGVSQCTLSLHLRFLPRCPQDASLLPNHHNGIGWLDSKLLVWANSVTRALKTELCHLIRA